jgi:hypothetical protein
VGSREAEEAWVRRERTMAKKYLWQEEGEKNHEDGATVQIPAEGEEK